LAKAFGIGGKRPVNTFKNSKKSYALRINAAEIIARHVEEMIKKFKI